MPVDLPLVNIWKQTERFKMENGQTNVVIEEPKVETPVAPVVEPEVAPVAPVTEPAVV